MRRIEPLYSYLPPPAGPFDEPKLADILLTSPLTRPLLPPSPPPAAAPIPPAAAGAPASIVSPSMTPTRPTASITGPLPSGDCALWSSKNKRHGAAKTSVTSRSAETRSASRHACKRCAHRLRGDGRDDLLCRVCASCCLHFCEALLPALDLPPQLVVRHKELVGHGLLGHRAHLAGLQVRLYRLALVRVPAVTNEYESRTRPSHVTKHS